MLVRRTNDMQVRMTLIKRSTLGFALIPIPIKRQQQRL